MYIPTCIRDGNNIASDLGLLMFSDLGNKRQNTSGMSVPKNIGVVIGIVLLTCIELEIYCMLYAVHKL